MDTPETKEPVVLHYPGRRSVGYFGAVRLRDGKFVYQREDGLFNGETFFRFLKRLRQASSHARPRVVVILDNAQYHHARLHKAWRERTPCRFGLAYLPAYSPELNPIERVWKLTRRKATHNQYFPTLNTIANAVEPLFTTFGRGSETLRRLCAIT